jgi:hypothetical protein
VLNEAQQGAFERYIRAGGGFTGVHAASDTEYSWAWYGGLVGAYFDSIRRHADGDRRGPRQGAPIHRGPPAPVDADG